MKIKKTGYENLDRPLEHFISLSLQTANGPLLLEVRPLPLGFLDGVEKLIPMPKPPRTGWVRGRRGRFERDERGQLIAEVDDQDPIYLKQKEITEKRHTTAILHAVLSSSPEIVFSAENDGTPEFYDKISEELIAAGMNSAHQARVIRVMRESIGLDEDELADAKKN